MSSENKWLVKSNDTLMGPLEFNRVVESIFTGEIHLLDEIKGPFERWRPIKDHSLFAAAIERLKATTYETRESTVTATMDLNTEATKSMTGSSTQEMTKTPQLEQTAELSVNEITRMQPGATPPPHPPIQQAPHKVKTSGVFLLSFLILVAAGAGYLVYDFQQTKLIEQKISAYDQLTDNALIFLKNGDYQKALKNFSMAYNISPNDPNLIIEMAPLLVQFDGQFSQVEAMISGLLASNYKKDYVRRGKNIIGLTFSYRKQFKRALQFYDDAIAVDSQFLPPYLNKAFVLLKLKQPEKAVELMRRVVTDYSDKAMAHYLYYRSLLSLGIQTKDKKYFREVLSASSQFPQKFSDLKQEVLFLVAIAKMNLEVEQAEMERLVKSFLMVDLELTNLHVHDTSIDFQIFNWLDSIPICKKMMESLTEYSARLLEGFCFLKMNQTVKAKKIFEELLSQGDKDGLLQALYASSLIKLNEISQAKNTLGFINQVDKKQSVVETILRGCLLAEDLSCGQAIFRGRHSKHISLLYSHWGNGEINLQKNRKEVQKSIQMGLQISPNFAPLLKLRRQF